MLLCRQQAVPGNDIADDYESGVDCPAHREDYHYGQPGVIDLKAREYPDYTHSAYADESCKRWY